MTNTSQQQTEAQGAGLPRPRYSLKDLSGQETRILDANDLLRLCAADADCGCDRAVTDTQFWAGFARRLLGVSRFIEASGLNGLAAKLLIDKACETLVANLNRGLSDLTEVEALIDGGAVLVSQLAEEIDASTVRAIEAQ